MPVKDLCDVKSGLSSHSVVSGGMLCGMCSFARMPENRWWHRTVTLSHTDARVILTRNQCPMQWTFKLGLIFQVGLKEAYGLCRLKESGSHVLHEQLAADFVFHKSTTKGKWKAAFCLLFCKVCQRPVKYPADILFPVPGLQPFLHGEALLSWP